MKRVIAAMALAGLALWGCNNKAEESVSTPAKTGGKKEAAAPGGKHFVIGMSQCNLKEPWRVQMNADIEAAAKEHPEIEMVWKDAANESGVQQSQVSEFVQQKVNLIIISPKESRPLTKPVADAMDAGIPVIVLDRKLDGDKFTTFIGADNVKIGEAAGKYLVKLLNGQGNVVELKGLMTSTPAQDRHNGFMKGIAGSQLKVVFDPDCQWQQEKAQTEMKSALANQPKIDAVYGHNDPSAHGAYLATRQEGKGREKQIKFVGIDALPHEGVRYVKDGLLSATFQYPTGGKEAINTALKILNGEKVERNYTLGTRIYTPDNVAKGGEAL